MVCTNKKVSEKGIIKVSEIVKFFKELFMLQKEDKSMVGLSGFRKPVPVRQPVHSRKISKELKLSDLMRRA